MSNQLPDSNRKLTFEKVKTNSVYTRKNLVTIENMARLRMIKLLLGIIPKNSKL
ncbi:hypothetical protein NDK43_10840 [Neobacillus pocheonensis]|uniref:Uncharacterized protein n=1 Tax=Neobacillus pocheonensis TaxID=363869 RepID=A0ABT0W9N1_9BACI|nr:hypothetical protein [Neobacillus pocheonensis]